MIEYRATRNTQLGRLTFVINRLIYRLSRLKCFIIILSKIGVGL